MKSTAKMNQYELEEEEDYYSQNKNKKYHTVGTVE
jgi:hypothetical protein